LKKKQLKKKQLEEKQFEESLQVLEVEDEPLTPYKFFNKSENCYCLCMFVATSIRITSVERLDLPNQSVRVTFTLVVRVVHSQKYKIFEEGDEKNWPRLLVNDKEYDLSDHTKKKEKNLEIFICRMDEEITFDPNLINFPFDEFNVQLKIGISYKKSEIEGKPSRVYFSQLPCTDQGTWGSFGPTPDHVPDYDINSKLNFDVKVDTIEYTGGKFTYLYNVVFSFILYRHPDRFVFSTIVPLFLLNMCATAIILLPGDAFGDRLSAIITVMLALFAFIPTIRNDLPRVSYTTVLEHQIFVSIGLIFLTLVESVIQNYLNIYLFIPTLGNTNMTDSGYNQISKTVSYTTIALSLFCSCGLLGYFGYLIYKCKTKQSKDYKSTNDIEGNPSKSSGDFHVENWTKGIVPEYVPNKVL